MSQRRHAITLCLNTDRWSHAGSDPARPSRHVHLPSMLSGSADQSRSYPLRCDRAPITRSRLVSTPAATFPAIRSAATNSP